MYLWPMRSIALEHAVKRRIPVWFNIYRSPKGVYTCGVGHFTRDSADNVVSSGYNERVYRIKVTFK